MANEQKIIQDVQKAVDELSNSFKVLDDVIGKNMANQKKLIANLQEIKKNLGASKSLKEFVNLQKEMDKQQAELNKRQKEALDLAKKNEQRKQQVIKTQQAAIQAAKKEQIENEKLKQSKIRTEQAERRLNAQKEKAERQSREASRAYNVESKRLLELTKRAKDAAIQYGVNSKQARALIREQQELDRRIKKVDATLGQHQRNVGNYGSAWSKITGFLGGFGLALGGAQVAMKAFNGVVKNSQVAGDSWEITMRGMEGALNGFFRAVGSGQFDKVLQFMRDGRDAAREYAAAMDDLFEGGEGARIQIAELNKQIAEWETIRKNAVAAKEYQQVIDAAERIGEIEIQKLELIQEENRRRFEAESKNLQKITGLEEERFIAFLKSYREQEDLREEAIKAIEIEDKLKRGVWIWEEQKLKDELQRIKDNTEGLQAYIDIYRKYGVTTDDMVKRTVDAYVEMIDAQTRSIKQQQQNEAAMARAREMLAEESTDKQTEIEREFYFRKLDLIDNTKQALRDLADEEIQIALDKTDKLKEIDQSRFEAFKEAENRRKELLKENEEAMFELGVEFSNALFENKIQNYEDDLEENRQYYDNLLANEELSEEQRSLLEAQRLEKENEIRAKQREAEKQQFLFNQAVKAGEVLMEMSTGIATATAMAPATFGASLAWIPLIKTSAALQLATILAQSIPAFAKGTDYSPEGLAEVGEKGTELVIGPDKRAWLTDDKSQLTYLQKGSKVVPHEKLMQSISNYTNSQIVNNGDKITGQDALIGKLVSRMIDENGKANKSIIKELRRNRPIERRETTIDRMRTDTLKNRLRN